MAKKKLEPNLEEHEIVVSGGKFYEFVKRCFDIFALCPMNDDSICSSSTNDLKTSIHAFFALDIDNELDIVGALY